MAGQKLKVTDIVVGRINARKEFSGSALRKIMESPVISREDKLQIAGACEKAGRYDEAAKIYGKLGIRQETKISAEFNEDAGRYDEAAKTYLKLGMKKKAAEVYEKAERYVDATRTYLEAGMKEKAAEMQLLQGNIADAISILETMEAVNGE